MGLSMAINPTRILIVDDEPAIRRLNSDLLMEAGYEGGSAVADGCHGLGYS